MPKKPRPVIAIPSDEDVHHPDEDVPMHVIPKLLDNNIALFDYYTSKTRLSAEEAEAAWLSSEEAEAARLSPECSLEVVEFKFSTTCCLSLSNLSRFRGGCRQRRKLQFEPRHALDLICELDLKVF